MPGGGPKFVFPEFTQAEKLQPYVGNKQHWLVTRAGAHPFWGKLGQ